MTLPEPDHGRLADWRFLLPETGQRSACDFTDQRLARLLPYPATAPSAGPVDLVLGTDPRQEQLDQAHALLRPGGVCYLEWRGRLRPSARKLKRRLEAAGFVAARLYWSWPPDSPSVWVPLDTPTAARWVLRRRRPRTLVYRAWRVLRTAGLVRPRCAIAARLPTDERTGPLGVDLGDLGGNPVWALVAPGNDPLNKVLAFVGVRGRKDPALVLKMPRTPASVAPLEREATSLQRLQAMGAPPAGVPRLLFSHRDGSGLRAIAESPLEGRPLFDVLDRNRYPTLARRATDWLVQLAAVRTDRVERREKAVDVAVDAAAHAAGADRSLLIEAGRLASLTESLPVVFEQRDFSPWNVHIGRDGGLVVFDWESAEPEGYPALDLVYLLAYCGFFLDGALASGRLRESYRETFDSNLADECLTRYCRALAIAPDRLPALRTLTWLVHVQSALRRDPNGSSAGLFLDLLREEVSGGGGARAAR